VGKGEELVWVGYVDPFLLYILHMRSMLAAKGLMKTATDADDQ
jgi:hypothetical protein